MSDNSAPKAAERTAYPAVLQARRKARHPTRKRNMNNSSSPATSMCMATLRNAAGVAPAIVAADAVERE